MKKSAKYNIGIAAKKSKKKFTKRSSARSPLRLGILALIFLITLIVGGKILSLVDRLNRPYSETGTEIYRRENWDGDQIVNIALSSGEINLLSYNPFDKSVSLIKVPEEAYIEVPFGFGSWPVRSVYDLGQAEETPFGGLLLKQALSSIFGIPVNSYVVFRDDNQHLSGEQLVEKMRQGPLGFNILRQSQTDLSLMEMIKLGQGISGVRFDKVKTIDLTKSGAINKTKLADNSPALTITPSNLDQYLQGIFVDDDLKSEGLSVAVYNSTNHSGLGEKAARTIANMGGRVVVVSNSSAGLKQSLILGKESDTRRFLAEIFASSCAKKSVKIWPFGSESGCSGQIADVDTSRADINLFLGEDYYFRFNR